MRLITPHTIEQDAVVHILKLVTNQDIRVYKLKLGYKQ